MTLALLDGDIVAFRAAAGANKTFDWGDGEKSSSSDPETAVAAALETVTAWQALAKCRDVLVTFTGPWNFRKTVLPTYKAHRTQGKPPDYWTVVAAVKERFPTRTVDGLEADDVMGILATGRYRDACIVVTLDKDLRTVPGVHFNPTKDTKPRRVTEPEADHWWLMQTLTGDPTDGYKGLPGIGEKRALAILGPVGGPVDRMWSKVVAAYRTKKLTEDDALQQARVARILRREDYDKDSKEILLWGPKEASRLPLGTVCAALASPRA